MRVLLKIRIHYNVDNFLDLKGDKSQASLCENLNFLMSSLIEWIRDKTNY